MSDCEKGKPIEAAVAHEAVRLAIATRRSVRGFTSDPVSRSDIESILELGARAPSGSNIQPWNVHVLTGRALKQLTAALRQAHFYQVPVRPDYDYYPEVWRSPYLERRRKVGWDLYAAVGIQRGDRDASMRQVGRNYAFFDAPVGLIFTIDRDLRVGSWLDLGMFLQNVMIAARGLGLHTCPQAAIANYPAIIRAELGISDTQTIACGMALGHENETEAANRIRTDREPLARFVTFHER